MLSANDRRRIHVTGVALSRDDGSPCRAAVASSVDAFILGVEPSAAEASAVHTSARALATKIANLGIGILIELNGHTKGCRQDVLACRPGVADPAFFCCGPARLLPTVTIYQSNATDGSCAGPAMPAPLQMVFRSYPGTTGAPSMDAYLADVVSAPPELHSHFSERLVLLTHTALSTDHAAMYPDPPRTRPGREKWAARGREEGQGGEAEEVEGLHGLDPLMSQGPLIDCFNRAVKIDAETWALWARILLAVPARLWVIWHHSQPTESKSRLKAQMDAGEMGGD